MAKRKVKKSELEKKHDEDQKRDEEHRHSGYRQHRVRNFRQGHGGA